MNLPDAAAEFARQVVIALAGDAGRAERSNEGLVQKIKDQQDDNTRLRRLNAMLANDWHRIEKLVGREFTSPESTIDRVAYLAELEQKGNDELKAQRREHADTARELIKAVRQRDELLRAAREFLKAGGGSAELTLDEVVTRIEKEFAGS